MERMKKVFLVVVLVVLTLGAIFSLFIVKTNAATLMDDPLIRPTAGAEATPYTTILTAEAAEYMLDVARSQAESGYLNGIGNNPKVMYAVFDAESCEYRYYLIVSDKTISINCYGGNPSLFANGFLLYCWNGTEGWKMCEMRNGTVYESPRTANNYIWVSPDVGILTLPNVSASELLVNGIQAQFVNNEPLEGPYSAIYESAKALAANWEKLSDRTEMSVESIKQGAYAQGWQDGRDLCIEGHDSVYEQGYADGHLAGINTNNQQAFDKGYIKGVGDLEQAKLDAHAEGYAAGKDYGEKSGILTLEAFYGFLATIITAPYQMLILSLDFTLFGVHVGKACAAIAGVFFAIITLIIIKKLVGKS